MNAIEIRNLTKQFKNFTLGPLTLDLPQGYILGYIGQNGAGKTTTIKLIMDLLHPDSGTIRIFGQDTAADPDSFRNTIGYIPDECFFPGKFNLRDVAGVLKNFYKDFRLEEFFGHCRKWSLPEDKKVGEFSKGMQMRLMFASVMARDTRLLVLDEPTGGLDPVVRDEFLTLLQEYIADGQRSVIFSTHLMSDLDKIADFLCFIHQGKVIFHDTRDAVSENYMLVKGGRDELTDTLRTQAIGLKTHEFGFSALFRKDEAQALSNRFHVEAPTTEDIVIYHILGQKGAESVGCC